LRLTVYTDYALRLLMYLALKEDQLATIAEIAKSFAISRNHLMKVAYQLGVAGYVETVRGRGGGLRLAKPAATIGLGDVVRCTEPDMAIASCFKLHPGRSGPAARAARQPVRYFAGRKALMQLAVAALLVLMARLGPAPCRYRLDAAVWSPHA